MGHRLCSRTSLQSERFRDRSQSPYFDLRSKLYMDSNWIRIRDIGFHDCRTFSCNFPYKFPSTGKNGKTSASFELTINFQQFQQISGAWVNQSNCSKTKYLKLII